jgi:hypothetical protein
LKPIVRFSEEDYVRAACSSRPVFKNSLSIPNSQSVHRNKARIRNRLQRVTVRIGSSFCRRVLRIFILESAVPGRAARCELPLNIDFSRTSGPIIASFPRDPRDSTP